MAGESSSETSGLEETLGASPRATEDAAPDATQTERIGAFRLIQLLGEGGMGEVWLAEQLEPRRKLALKLVKVGMDTRQVVARFESERQALALMDHPAIAKIFDGGSTPEGRPYFAMEYVPGVPITEHCDTHQLSTAERLRLFIQVCDGIQHAHHKAIIHRDLKPSNILVCLVDGKPQAKIIDFGIAKATGYRLTEKTLFTEIGSFIGTPEYVSPEQANLTGQDVDTRADVYSLGVVLYQLLAGELPFDSKELRSSSYEELRRKIREVDPPRPSTRVDIVGSSSAETARNRRTEPRALKHQLQGDLDAITMKALEKDRARRYGTPSELAQDIERYLRHEPVVARPHSSVYRLRKYLARHRLGVSVAAGVAFLLVAFSVAMAFQLRRTALERDRADRERQASEKVSAFLANMLGTLKPEALGKALWNDLHQSVATTRRSHGASDQEIAKATASLDDGLHGVSPTQTALHLLDEQVLDRAGKTVEREMGSDPRTAGSLEFTLGKTYRNLGLFKQAEGHARRAVEIRRRAFGVENLDTLQAMNILGVVYYNEGIYSEAEKIDQETLAVKRRMLGSEHPETLQSINNLAILYDAEGRYDEALKLHLETLDVKRRVLGPEHMDTLNSMNNLAIVYYNKGDYDKCEKLLRQVLEVRRRLLPDRLETMDSMNNLAEIYSAEGRYKDAEALYRESLEAKRRVLGSEHPATLLTSQNLAETYEAEGRYAEAEKLYGETLGIIRRVLGAESSLALTTMTNLAQNYTDERRFEEAKRLATDVVDSSRKVFGLDHPNTLVGLASLADAYNGQGRFEKGAELAQDARAGYERIGSKTGPGIGNARAVLGRALSGLKRYPDAEVELLDAERLLSVGKGRDYRKCLESVVEMYRAWDRAEPGKGHAAQATTWAAKLVSGA